MIATGIVGFRGVSWQLGLQFLATSGNLGKPWQLRLEPHSQGVLATGVPFVDNHKCPIIVQHLANQLNSSCNPPQLKHSWTVGRAATARFGASRTHVTHTCRILVGGVVWLHPYSH